jgi:hypothetical protein
VNKVNPYINSEKSGERLNKLQFGSKTEFYAPSYFVKILHAHTNFSTKEGP